MTDQSPLAKAVAAIQSLYECGDLSFREMALHVGLDPKKDFKGADLRGVDLSYEDLSDFDFRGADLTGANLYKAVFKISSLAGARLQDATIEDVIAVRPRWSAFSPEKAWTPVSHQHAMSLAHWSRREYLYQITHRSEATFFEAPVRWLEDASFFLAITRDLAGKIRQALYLRTPELLWSLGGKLEEETLWHRTSDLEIRSDNVVEYLALHLFIYSHSLLVTAGGLDDVQIFSDGNDAAAERYLTSLMAEPQVSTIDDGFRVDGTVFGVGRAYPISASISRTGRVRFDSKPVIATEVPIIVLSPDEDTDVLFADWASRR